MTVVFHTADLHLSAASEQVAAYGFAVWREIVAHAEAHGASLLILAGDIFNTPDDCRQLAKTFKDILSAGFSGTALYIPGNHEADRHGLTLWQSQTWSPLITPPPDAVGLWWDGSSQQIPVEIALFPHQAPWRGHELSLPAKTGNYRFAIAHGLIPELCYTGPEEEVEDGGGSLPSHFFTEQQFDYVALGHIHGRRSLRLGPCLFHYPGSARVWRRGENGPRCVSKLTLAKASPLQVEDIPLKAAGCYRPLVVPAEAKVDDIMPWLPQDLSAADFVYLRIEGFVDEEHERTAIRQHWEKALQSRVRVAQVDDTDLQVLGRHRHHPFVQTFLQRWREREPAPGTNAAQHQVWLRARQHGLRLIHEALESQP